MQARGLKKQASDPLCSLQSYFGYKYNLPDLRSIAFFHASLVGIKEDNSNDYTT